MHSRTSIELLAKFHTFEIGDFEDVGSTLAGAPNDLWGVDLGEALCPQRVAEELANTRLDLENGLVGRRPKVKNTVVQPVERNVAFDEC